MTIILEIILLTTMAGICIPLGGLMASFEHIRPRWLEYEFRHFLIALGGGLLIGAVSLVLVPEGIAELSQKLLATPLILAGGVSIFAIEKVLGLRRHESPQLMGMMLDYIPEAIALGGLVALGSPLAPLLAILIGLQNLPEGFNAFREMRAQASHSSHTLLTMVLLVPIGPIAGLLGYFYLAEHHGVLGAVMLFASGGILYLIFQDIAPQAKLKKHWGPPLGAVLGFAIALFSQQIMMS
ncbi:ZIP family metal transporter [Shewanella sp. SR44-3]|uniref:ZIP family metal transporter n=1 Tax=unclassified Shewanella TaxID=196818 RepID=UPI0015F80D57|nr:divalent cation transporter [Shewanella sp. SR44-3]MBB1270835.1 divalent cation transporter [Shewanella sp. SR44-3]